MALSEGSQHIYRWEDPVVVTKFGKRCMTEVGNIKELEEDKTENYFLSPSVNSKGKSTSWFIRELTDELIKDMLERLSDRVIVEELKRRIEEVRKCQQKRKSKTRKTRKKASKKK